MIDITFQINPAQGGTMSTQRQILTDSHRVHQNENFDMIYHKVSPKDFINI